MTFWDWLAKSPLATAAKTFAAVLISAAIADWATGGEISLSNWETWIVAALVSAGPTIVNWLNPADDRYGNGSQR